MTGQGRRLGRDALHHVAVGRQHVDAVVEGAGARRGVRVEQAPLPAGGHRHPDGGSHPLAERTGGDLDPAGVPVLRVARGRGVPGAQCLQVLHLQAVAGQVELDVEGEAAVAAGEDEAVPAQPLVVGGVVPHDLLEQQVGERRQAHRRAGVSVAGPLDRVGGEHPNGVHRAQVQVAPPRPYGHGQREPGVAGRGAAGRGSLGRHGVVSLGCRFSVRRGRCVRLATPRILCSPAALRTRSGPGGAVGADARGAGDADACALPTGRLPRRGRGRPLRRGPCGRAVVGGEAGAPHIPGCPAHRAADVAQSCRWMSCGLRTPRA